jgi:RNA polymerase sigma-70 factor (ECF subfamily)
MKPSQLRAAIASARAGSAEGYEALLEAYGRRLYGYFLRSTGRHHDAEDMLGELLLRLVRQLESYDDRGRFEPWLFRIAANLVRDRIRRIQASPPAVSLSQDGEVSSTLAESLAAEEAPAGAELMAMEASARLMAALERLEPRTRHMILLRHFGQMSFREMADLYGCPLGTVLAKVHRGLRALRRLMGEQDGTD